MRTLFLVHLGATLCLVGLIWTIQWVHYPLMALVGEERFLQYHEVHSNAISWLVIPLMLTELGTAIWLVASRPAAIPAWAVWLGLLLVVGIWLSTAFLQVPRHGILARGFDSAAHDFLVASNWLRTIAWSLRGVLVLWMTRQLMAGP